MNMTTAEKISPCAIDNTPLQAQNTYTVEGRQFIVKPVFTETAKETLGQVLVKLMKADIEKE